VLPAGWEQQARDSGALQRARGVKDPATLLRVLLLHLACGYSLVEAAFRARDAGWCSLSDVALLKRLRSAQEWLRWIAHNLRPEPESPDAFLEGYRVKIVDATAVQEPGATGTSWRVHYVMRLENLTCEHFELTDVRGAEMLSRVPVSSGDLVMGDRAYGTPAGIAYVMDAGGHVLVRTSYFKLKLFEEDGTRIDMLDKARLLEVGEAGAWRADVKHNARTYRGRLIAIRKSRQATQREIRRIKAKASKSGAKVLPGTLIAAQYTLLWTSLPEADADAARVLALYRMRWQIEISFKRMKSLLGLGHLPKTSDPSSRAWLHGKMVVSLLIEKLLRQAEYFSPWGYRYPATPQPLARDKLHGQRGDCRDPA
jgi:hypothetical protein